MIRIQTSRKKGVNLKPNHFIYLSDAARCLYQSCKTPYDPFNKVAKRHAFKHKGELYANLKPVNKFPVISDGIVRFKLHPDKEALLNPIIQTKLSRSFFKLTNATLDITVQE